MERAAYAKLCQPTGDLPRPRQSSTEAFIIDFDFPDRFDSIGGVKKQAVVRNWRKKNKRNLYASSTASGYRESGRNRSSIFVPACAAWKPCSESRPLHSHLPRVHKAAPKIIHFEFEFRMFSSILPSPSGAFFLSLHFFLLPNETFTIYFLAECQLSHCLMSHFLLRIMAQWEMYYVCTMCSVPEEWLFLDRIESVAAEAGEESGISMNKIKCATHNLSHA